MGGEVVCGGGVGAEMAGEVGCGGGVEWRWGE